MGRDKVIESLSELEEVGLIRCDRAGKNSGVTNTYYILELPEGSPKARLPNSDAKKSQGETTGSPEKASEVVLRQDSKEDSVKEDSLKVDCSSTDSPQPGGGSTSKPAQYDFGTFKSFYPLHRMSDKNERASRAEWNAINGDAQTKVAIIQHLSAMVNDPEWTRDQGNWVPAPQKYLAQKRWKNELSWAALYRPECQAVVDYFLEVTGQSAAVNKLTEDRLKMLSARIHEAKAMKLEIDPHNERSLMKDSIDAAWNSAYYKKHPEAFTLESVYGSAERFEKLIKREVPACS
jgi:hypothetical protein